MLLVEDGPKRGSGRGLRVTHHAKVYGLPMSDLSLNVFLFAGYPCEHDSPRTVRYSVAGLSARKGSCVPGQDCPKPLEVGWPRWVRPPGPTHHSKPHDERRNHQAGRCNQDAAIRLKSQNIEFFRPKNNLKMLTLVCLKDSFFCFVNSTHQWKCGTSRNFYNSYKETETMVR